MLTNSLLDGLGGRLGTRRLFLGRDRDPTHVPWVNGTPSHGVASPRDGRLGVSHEKVVIVFNHCHELKEGLLVVIIRTSCTPVAKFIHNQTPFWEVERNGVDVVGVEDNARYFRQGGDTRPCSVRRLSLPGVHLLSN